MQDEKPLKILILASEVVPFAKVGGLADVVGAFQRHCKNSVMTCAWLCRAMGRSTRNGSS